MRCQVGRNFIENPLLSHFLLKKDPSLLPDPFVFPAAPPRRIEERGGRADGGNGGEGGTPDGEVTAA